VDGEPNEWGTWRDPLDGHVYAPISWEATARRLADAADLSLIDFELEEPPQ
jgi:hypothetical protein